MTEMLIMHSLSNYVKGSNYAQSIHVHNCINLEYRCFKATITT